MYRMFDANHKALRERIKSWLTQHPTEFEATIKVCEDWIEGLLKQNLALYHLHGLASLPPEMSLTDRLVSASLEKLGLAFNWLATSEEGQEPAEAALIGNALAVACGRSYAIHGPKKLNWIGEFICSINNLLWEEFADSAAKTFRENSKALNRFTIFLNDIVASANNAEDEVVVLHPRSPTLTSILEKSKYRRSIQDVWDEHSDLMLLKESEAFEIFRRVDPDEFIKIVDQLPHPALVSSCLYSRALQASLQDVLTLLRSANLVVNADGKVNPNGTAAILLLRLASEQLLEQHTKSADIKDLDEAITIFRNGVKEILGALFARSDGVALAWCWLENLMRQPPNHSQRDSSQHCNLVINYIRILVGEICAQLEHCCAYGAWIKEVKPNFRQYRSIVVLAVAAFTNKSDVNIGDVAKSLLKNDGFFLSSASEQACVPMATLRMIPGDSLAKIPDVASWYCKTWSELRLERERSWPTNQTTDQNPAEIMGVWGLGVIESLLNQSKFKDARAMWLAVEQIFREAILVEPNAYPLFWTQASTSLFHWWPKLFIENKDQSGDLEDKSADSALVGKLLFPYAKINREFMAIIVGLQQAGLSATLLKTATNQTNQDLLNMIRRFKEVARGINDSQAFNPVWVASLKKLEVALANSLTCNTAPNK